ATGSDGLGGAPLCETQACFKLSTSMSGIRRFASSVSAAINSGERGASGSYSTSRLPVVAVEVTPRMPSIRNKRSSMSAANARSSFRALMRNLIRPGSACTNRKPGVSTAPPRLGLRLYRARFARGRGGLGAHLRHEIGELLLALGYELL